MFHSEGKMLLIHVRSQYSNSSFSNLRPNVPSPLARKLEQASLINDDQFLKVPVNGLPHELHRGRVRRELFSFSEETEQLPAEAAHEAHVLLVCRDGHSLGTVQVPVYQARKGVACI